MRKTFESSANRRLCDFTPSLYLNFLWVKEILDLKTEHNKQVYYTKTGHTMTIQYVTIFGTVIERKQINEGCIMYKVDDGTGNISCRSNILLKDSEDLQDWDWGETLVMGDTSVKESTFQEASTMCDTVFNDKTIQQDEFEADAKARLWTLNKLRWSLINDFESAHSVDLGDMVCIHGRVYAYFGMLQIYINVIRPITIEEEMYLSILKLRDWQRVNGLGIPEVKPSEVSTIVPEIGGGSAASSCLVERRESGLMTFDNVEENRSRARVGRNVPQPSLSIPPSPLTVPGCLSSFPPDSEVLTPFDTICLEHDTLPQSSSDEGDFILPTPRKRR